MMKKTLVVAVAAFSMVSLSTTASAFITGACKACHSINKDKAGPSWSSVAKAYGSDWALAKVFKDGFKLEDRKVAAFNARWHGQAGMMTGQFNALIKGHEDDAAKALFEAVKSGRM